MPDENSRNSPWRLIRRIGVAIAGSVVLLVGIAMIALPGPALVVIPLGLGILGLEFPFARRWLSRLRQKGQSVYSAWRKPRR